jgi:RNA-directed DNA polymerase
MTVALATGAASRESQVGHAIDWRKAHREVRRLQARIVKATQFVEKPRPSRGV